MNSDNVLNVNFKEIDSGLLAKDKKYESINLTGVNGLLSPEKLNEVSELLTQNGKLTLDLDNLSEDQINQIVSNLKIVGLVNIMKDNSRINAEKKVRRKADKNNAGNANANGSENPWKTLKLEEKSDLIYEEELVDPFDNYQKFSKASDCITKPKPCKNCNCGRAQAQNGGEAQPKDPNTNTPSCGKCYLGDAFRCAGCPFKGMPAFEPGQKVEFNAAGAGDMNVEAESTGVNVKDKKVTLDL